MTYYGAPSNGCELCRDRRVKVCVLSSLLLLGSTLERSTSRTKLLTDNHSVTKVSQSVSSCKRSDRSCPEYRELGMVIFRDENPRIARYITRKNGNNGTAELDDDTVEVTTAGPHANSLAWSVFQLERWLKAEEESRDGAL